jgi:hypothetical protein
MKRRPTELLVSRIQPAEAIPCRTTSVGPDLLALVIGTVAALIFLGPDFLLLNAPYFITPFGDSAAEMSGYLHFAQDQWRFPLFGLPMINQPEGMNQLFVGGIPLFALIAKIVHGLTGVTVNLFGFWYFVCYVLQAHAFYFLVKQINDRRPLIAAIAAVSGVLAYAFITRFTHVSLCGQFLNIYAIGMVVATTKPDVRPAPLLIWLGILSFIAMFIFAYLAIANVVLFGAGAVSLWWLGRIDLRRAVQYSLLFGALLLVLAAAGGYFWGVGRAEPAGVASYGALGFNVGSLVIPHQSVLSPDRPLFYDWWSGDFYLGAGIIALWGFLLLMHPRAIFEPIRKNLPLTAVLLAFVAFCASNHVAFGKTTLFDYPLPALMEPVVGMARAGGRLFWPVGYFLMAAPLALTIEKCPRYATAMILAVVMISGLEATGTYGFVKDRIQRTPRLVLNYPGLQRVMRQHQVMRLYPSFWCDPGKEGDADNIDGSPKRIVHWQLAFSAAQANLASNSAIIARKIKDCDRELGSMLALQRDELDIFLSLSVARTALATTRADVAEVCRSFQLGPGTALMCSSQWTADTVVPIPQLNSINSIVPELRAGQSVDFGAAGNKSDFIDSGWWRDSERESTWTDGPESAFSIKLPNEPSARLSISIRLAAFLHPPQIPNRIVRVSVDGDEVSSWLFTDGNWHSENIELPAGLDGKTIKIILRQSDNRSPNDLGIGDGHDPRRLGVALKTASLVRR